MVSYLLMTLVDAATLARRLGDPSVAIVDCRFNLDRSRVGRARVRARAHSRRRLRRSRGELSGPRTGVNGRHPLPDPSTFSEALGRLGIDVERTGRGLRPGCRHVRQPSLVDAPLDGPPRRRRARGRVRRVDATEVACTAGVESRPARRLHRRATIGDGRRCRGGGRLWRGARAGCSSTPGAPERFRGDVETLDKAAGHIPGAVNHFFRQNVDEGGLFLAPAELRGRLRATVGGTDADRIVCYCGSGVTACHMLLALEHAGLPGARLYPGSWSEWSSNPASARKKKGRPVRPAPRSAA